MVKTLDIGHPTGSFQVRLELGGTENDPSVERGGLVRTARLLFDGFAFPRGKRLKTEAGAQ
jgi:4-oxalomesaconate tautomerase